MRKTNEPQPISPQLVSPEEWSIFETAMTAAHENNIEFLVAGAFALGVYTERWRPTKDIDLLILPRDRDVMIDALTKAGFKDYYDQLHYDRGWIYRCTRDNYLVDVIWRMANRRANVDEQWFENAPAVLVRNVTFHIVPPEELLWHKLYVLQRDRCDWPDVLNLLYTYGHKLDWKYLMQRMENDMPLLGAALSLFCWLCPGRTMKFPKWLRDKFHLDEFCQRGPEVLHNNVSFLDSRDWFVASPPPRHLLEPKPLEEKAAVGAT
jgi:hypothetical protein